MNRFNHGPIARRDAVPVAMCLYNVGLVEQAAGNSDAARAAWTRSLQLRPNRTVQRRLASLGTDEAEPETPEGLEEAASIAKAHLCEMELADDECEDIEVSIEDLSRGGLHAALIRAEGGLQGAQSISVWVQGGEEWFGFEVSTHTLEPGAFGISMEYGVEDVRVHDLLVGGSPEIEFRTTLGVTDNDNGGCSSTDTYEANRVVCTLDSGAPACLRLPEEGRLETSECNFDECCEEDEDPEEYSERFAYSYRFEGDRVQIQRRAGNGESDGDPAQDLTWEGTHRFESLVQRACEEDSRRCLSRL